MSFLQENLKYFPKSSRTYQAIGQTKNAMGDKAGAVKDLEKAVELVGRSGLEGLGAGGKLHPVQQAWIDEQVPACGFCQNGQMLTAKVLLDKNPRPSDADIRQGMAATLCRCMTYYRVQAAIKRASTALNADASTSTSEVNS